MRARWGVTLIELLIVMTILLMITAAAIPLMVPALQNRRGREAARLVSSFISGARSRAIETGRPAGVMLERFNGNPFAMSLSYVEVPPPYGGDTTGATCQVAFSGIPVWPPIGAFVVFQFNINFGSGFNPSLVHVGDQVQINYEGPRYSITGPDSAPQDGVVDSSNVIATLTLPNIFVPPLPPTPPPPPFSQFPWLATASASVPYQIFRQPRRSSAQPLQLPDGIVVDLANSGVGLFQTNYNTSTGSNRTLNPVVPYNPVFTFAPGGSVDYLTVGGNLIRPKGAIYLLIGRRDQMPDVAPSGRLPTPTSPPSAAINNLNDPDSIWITVSYQTGLVASAENYILGVDRLNGPVQTARTFAKQAQSMGGR